MDQLVRNSWEKLSRAIPVFLSSFEKIAGSKLAGVGKVIRESATNGRFASTSGAIEPKDSLARVVVYPCSDPV